MAVYRSQDTTCCVFGCSSKLCISTLDHVQFHRLPNFASEPEKSQVLLKWIQALKLPGKITRDMVVCSDHFSAEDFEHVGKEAKLKDGPVPSKNLPLVWRNKFYPRDYGRLIKLLEYRGIGRLRLCHEAKLVRRMKRIQSQLSQASRSANSVTKNLHKTQKKNLQKEVSLSKDASSPDQIKVVSTFSLSPNDPNSFSRKENGAQNIDEITIKEEPMSDQEGIDMDILDREETIEEMLARMNEDSNETNQNETNQNETQGNNEQSEEPEKSVENTRQPPSGDEIWQSEDKKYTCQYCGKEFFKSPKQLYAHMLNHPEYRNKGKKDERSKVLQPNANTNQQATPYVCMLCEESFKYKSSLIQHVEKHTILNVIRCRMCKQYFETTQELDLHVKKHKIIKKEYSCRECGEKFRTKSACWDHLNGHMRARSKPGLSCDVCGRVLSTKATLKEHMFIHSGEKPFECQLCGRKIRHRANFIIHVQGHSLGQPHVCQTCGMGFAKKNELNSHIAAEHPEDRPYYCIICGMRFRTESRFHKHAVSHNAYLEE